MRAVISRDKGQSPLFVENRDVPRVSSESHVLLNVKAVSIKNLDRAIASGKHYSASEKPFVASVVGTDGVGVLSDGTRVYGFGIQGMLAEQALIKKGSIVKIPDALSDALACALPNALMGSVIALKTRANLAPGQTVLINGATGITGKIAVQVAKYYGAKSIIVTGRNEQVLEALLGLGADITISLNQTEESFKQELKEIEKRTSIDVVIDYLWGSSAQFILETFKGDGVYTHQTKFVNVGAMSGDTLSLSSSILRGTDITILGSGLGSWTDVEMSDFFTLLLPEFFDLASKGLLHMEIQTYDIAEAEAVWNTTAKDPKRLVFLID